MKRPRPTFTERAKRVNWELSGSATSTVTPTDVGSHDIPGERLLGDMLAHGVLRDYSYHLLPEDCLKLRF